MEQNDEASHPKEKSENSSENSTRPKLKILEEVDKEIIKDTPPNFNSYIFSRIHDNTEGKLRND